MHAVSKAVSPARDTLIFSLLNLSDFLTTLIGITYMGTYEGNGMFTDAQGHPLWFRMVILKFVICAIFYTALRFFARVRHYGMYKLAARVAICYMVFIVLWNITIATLTYLYR